MLLFQDSKKREDLFFSSTISPTVLNPYEIFQHIVRSNRYDFYISTNGRTLVAKLNYDKEVEKHLTEINYLGI